MAITPTNVSGYGYIPAAEQMWQQGPPEYFPGDTVAGFTPDTYTGWQTGIDNLGNAQNAAYGLADEAGAAYDWYTGQMQNFNPFNPGQTSLGVGNVSGNFTFGLNPWQASKQKAAGGEKENQGGL